MKNADGPSNPRKAREWLPMLNLYRSANPLRSLFEIVVTAFPFALLWATMWICLPKAIVLFEITFLS